MSYKHVFDKAIQIADTSDYKSTFETFHDHPELYHFIIAPNNQFGTDDGAILDANRINPDLTNQLITKGPSLLGNGSVEIDGVESRHILTLVFLHKILGPEWGNVVEIGGGYGNYLRLVQEIVNYTSWSIVDLYYILDLQRWVFSTLEIDTSNVTSIESKDIISQAQLKPDLVIGIHSLSELSIEDFQAYYDTIISKAKYLFYVSARGSPSVELLQQKKKIIETDFILKYYLIYENETSVMMLFYNNGVIV